MYKTKDPFTRFCLQMEGPVSPAELVEMLQTTMEEQVVGKKEEKRRADLQLREEQDAAYAAALKIDQVHLLLCKQSLAKQMLRLLDYAFRVVSGERKTPKEAKCRS